MRRVISVLAMEIVKYHKWSDTHSRQHQITSTSDTAFVSLSLSLSRCYVIVMKFPQLGAVDELFPSEILAICLVAIGEC